MGFGFSCLPRHAYAHGMSDAVLTDLLDFLRESPTPCHAVESAARRLQAAGFRELAETDSWDGLAGGRYYVVQGGSTVVAFVVPAARKVDAFRIVSAHT